MANIEAINFELSGGSFNVNRRRLATFTMTTLENGKVKVSDDRPSWVACHYKDTEFANVEAAVSYWKAIDEKRSIMA